VGDAVYGDNLGLKGGFAERATGVRAPSPAQMSFVEASSIRRLADRAAGRGGA
jgi:hypothetical protein